MIENLFRLRIKALIGARKKGMEKSSGKTGGEKGTAGLAEACVANTQQDDEYLFRRVWFVCVPIL